MDVFTASLKINNLRPYLNNTLSSYPKLIKDQSLPEEEEGENENIEQSEELVQGNETILVVDDEPALLELVQATLQSLGYRVLTAGSGKQALQILSDTPAIDLLFSDVVMPDINGFELAEQANKQYPDLKILLTSGCTEKVLAENAQSRLVKRVLLTKPYDQSELAQRLRQILSDKDSSTHLTCLPIIEYQPSQ